MDMAMRSMELMIATAQQRITTLNHCFPLMAMGLFPSTFSRPKWLIQRIIDDRFSVDPNNLLFHEKSLLGKLSISLFTDRLPAVKLYGLRY